MLSETLARAGDEIDSGPARPSGGRFSPSAGDQLVTGTAAAVAARLEVEPIAVRLAFLVVFLAGGWGLALYGAAWATLVWRQPDPVPRAPARPDPVRTLALGAVVLGLLLVLQARVVGFVNELVWPAAIVALGLAFLWPRLEATDPGATRARARIHAVRVLGGLLLVAGGLGALLAANVSFRTMRDGIMAAGVVIAGTLLVFAPSVFRLTRSLSDERQQRIRADERAEVAAHLHDSVLQTLTLIQKRADEPEQMAALARRQERELRRWLYGMPEPDGERRFAAALEAVVAEVEAHHLVSIDNVTVGDALVDPRLQAVIAAAREALVNAAKFSGARTVHQYAELTPTSVEVYVRDRGAGFDPDQVAGHRRGISDSIVGRMVRAGGSAEIRSRPGEGTEVRLVLPRRVA